MFQVQAMAGGTVIPNGGDPIFEFVEAARFSMIETLKTISNDPNERGRFCENAALSSEQSKFCRAFFAVVVTDMLRLSQGQNKVQFVLRDQPLYVEDREHKMMSVAGRTLLGPQGPIELNRDLVKTMVPTQVLFLITHEFQHKSNFNGVYVNDNDPIGPFDTGRDLIDKVAESVVEVARRTHHVGTQFEIHDLFDCVASAGQAKIGARVVASRAFYSSDLKSYETTSGKNPTDGAFFVPENNGTLWLKFVIHEPNNCESESELRNVDKSHVPPC
jgi:hypothetical protein